MTKLICIYLLTLTFQIVGQTVNSKSVKLQGKWLLKAGSITFPGCNIPDSTSTTIEFKETGMYTVRSSYYYKDPTKAHKPIVISGKWKINEKNVLHLYASNEESPSPYQIPGKDVKITKLNKNRLVILELLTNPKRKSTYARQIN